MYGYPQYPQSRQQNSQGSKSTLEINGRAATLNVTPARQLQPQPQQAPPRETPPPTETPFHEYASSTAALIMHLVEEFNIDASKSICNLLVSNVNSIQCGILDDEKKHAILQRIIADIMSLYYLHDSHQFDEIKSGMVARQEKPRIFEPYCESFPTAAARADYIKKTLSDLIYQVIIFIGPAIIYETLKAKIAEYANGSRFSFLENERVGNIVAGTVTNAASLLVFITNNALSQKIVRDALWSYMYPKISGANNGWLSSGSTQYTFGNIPAAFYSNMYPRGNRGGLYYPDGSGKTIDTECISALLQCIAQLIRGDIGGIKASIDSLVELFDIDAVIHMIMLAVVLVTGKHSRFSANSQNKCEGLVLAVLDDRGLLDHETLSIADAIVVAFDVAVRRRVIPGYLASCFEFWKWDSECAVRRRSQESSQTRYEIEQNNLKLDSDAILRSQLNAAAFQGGGGRSKAKLIRAWATLAPKLKSGEASIARFRTRLINYLRTSASVTSEGETDFFFPLESAEVIGELFAAFKGFKIRKLLGLLNIRLYVTDWAFSPLTHKLNPDDFAWALYHYTKRAPNSNAAKQIPCYHTQHATLHALYHEEIDDISILKVAAVENIALMYADYSNKDMYAVRAKLALQRLHLRRSRSKAVKIIEELFASAVAAEANAPKRADIKLALDKLVALFAAST